MVGSELNSSDEDECWSCNLNASNLTALDRYLFVHMAPTAMELTDFDQNRLSWSELG